MKNSQDFMSHDSTDKNHPEQGTPQRHEADQGCLGLGWGGGQGDENVLKL